MSSNGAIYPAPKRTFRRVWLPWLILMVPAVFVAAMWAWPGENFITATRRFNTNAAVVAAVLLFWAWGVWISDYRRTFLVVGCIVAGVLAATIEGLECTGNMGIVIRPRFGKKSIDVVTAHRQQQQVLAADPYVAAAEPALDYPAYRGRNRDAVVIGPPLRRDWVVRPPREVWRQPIGGGYAQFAIAGNAAITIEQRGGDEAVVCYDTATGVERWKHVYPARFIEAMGGEGPRATPTVADGNVYSLGAAGKFVCLDLVTGEPKWAVDILDGNKNVRWGMSGSPLVYDDVVVVNPGAQTDSAKGRAVRAYDRNTGSIRWASGNETAGYSSPMLATIAGHRQIVLFESNQLAGYDAQTGTELWSYPFETQYGINVAQPLLLDDDRVFITAGYGMGCVMLRVSESNGKWSAEKVWDSNKLRCKFTSPVYQSGFIYGLDEGHLACLDAKTGERKWREGRYEHGQILLSGDLLVVLAENGRLALVEATPEGHREIGAIPALRGAKTWNPPALANGRLYIRNAEEMACYELAELPISK
jgi:outer membrane protein assembly factor BamB